MIANSAWTIICFWTLVSKCPYLIVPLLPQGKDPGRQYAPDAVAPLPNPHRSPTIPLRPMDSSAFAGSFFCFCLQLLVSKNWSAWGDFGYLKANYLCFGACLSFWEDPFVFLSYLRKPWWTYLPKTECSPQKDLSSVGWQNSLILTGNHQYRTGAMV